MKMYVCKLKEFTKVELKLQKLIMLNGCKQLNKGLDLMRVLKFDKFDTVVGKQLLRVLRGIVIDTPDLDVNIKKDLSNKIIDMIDKINLMENEKLIKEGYLTVKEVEEIEED